MNNKTLKMAMAALAVAAATGANATHTDDEALKAARKKNGSMPHEEKTMKLGG